MFGNLKVPERWKSDDWPAAFPRWFHQQRVLFQERRLSPDKAPITSFLALMTVFIGG